MPVYLPSIVWNQTTSLISILIWQANWGLCTWQFINYSMNWYYLWTKSKHRFYQLIAKVVTRYWTTDNRVSLGNIIGAIVKGTWGIDDREEMFGRGVPHAYLPLLHSPQNSCTIFPPQHGKPKSRNLCWEKDVAGKKVACATRNHISPTRCIPLQLFGGFQPPPPPQTAICNQKSSDITFTFPSNFFPSLDDEFVPDLSFVFLLLWIWANGSCGTR